MMDENYAWILNMTNNEAAAILKTLFSGITARANGKSMTDCARTMALMKAIAVLENTPDEKEIRKGTGNGT